MLYIALAYTHCVDYLTAVALLLAYLFVRSQRYDVLQERSVLTLCSYPSISQTWMPTPVLHATE